MFFPQNQKQNKEVLFYHSKSSIILEVPARVTRQEKVKASKLEKKKKKRSKTFLFTDDLINNRTTRTNK